MKLLSLAFLLVCSICAGGCGFGGEDDTPDAACGACDGLPWTGVSVLFMIDDSGSMASKQRKLVISFSRFVEGMAAENETRRLSGEAPMNFRVAVVSTSIGLRYLDSSGNLIEQTTYSAADLNECETSYVLTEGSPYPVGQFLAAPGNATILDSETLDHAIILEQFRANALLGVCGSGQEQGLLAMRRALEANPAFVQENSRLIVVFLSDEQDCSDPDRDLNLSLSADRCVEEALQPGGGLLGPVSAYADFLQGLTPRVTVASIVSASGSIPTVTPGLCSDPACESACSSGSSPRSSPCWCGGMSAGSRYLDLVQAFGGSSFGVSICEPDFDLAMQRLATVALGP